MRLTLLISCLCLFIFSCGDSGSNTTDSTKNVHVNKYKISAGADSLLTSYNRLFTGIFCYNKTDNDSIVVMTMPVSCYLTAKPKVDSPISFISLYDKDTCNTLWDHSLAGLDNCAPKTTYWPLDSNLNSDQFYFQFIETAAYRKFADTANSNLIRDYHTVIRLLPVVSPHSIIKIVSWSIESDTGYWSKRLPGADDDGYKNLYNSTGVKVSVITRRDTSKIIDCYILTNSEGRTMRWKDTSATK